MLSIKWTEHAKRENADILKFWIKHNQSNIYSKKIRKDTNKKLSLLKKNVFMGEELEDFDAVRRILILENFSLFFTRLKLTLSKLFHFGTIEEIPKI